MNFVKVSDENGVKLNGLMDTESPKDSDERVPVWILNDKESGFGETVGQITMRPLKLLPNGMYGA
jgi:hypothetical protein